MENFQKFGYRFLNIETLGNCNMNCSFCNWDRRADKAAILPTETVYKLIDEAKKAKVESINFSQFNEPTLDKRLFEFIKYAKKLKLYVRLTSNGLLFANHRVFNGMTSNLSAPNHLTLSVQTLNKNEFSDVRGIKMNYEKYKFIIYKFISACIKKKINITMDMACNFLNKKKLLFRKILGFSVGDPSVPLSLDQVYPDLVDFLRGYEKFEKNYTFNESKLEDYFNNLKCDYRDQDSFEIFPNIDIKIKRFMYGQRLMDFQPYTGSFKCGHPILAVLASGDVVPCCHMSSPFFTLGNAKTNKISDLLDKNKSLICNIRTKEGRKPEVCKKCFGEKTKRAVVISRIKEKVSFQLSTGLLNHEKK